MNTELSKKDVLNLLRIWEIWINGPDPANNKPEEFIRWDEYSPVGARMAIGAVLHLFLWCSTKCGLLLRLPFLTIWATETSIKYDYLYWEPLSCRWNNSYTDMGLAYIKSGKIDKAIKCLNRSWRVYPCPHNTTYGLKSRLCKKLKEFPVAQEAVFEYQIMWKKFKNLRHNLSLHQTRRTIAPDRRCLSKSYFILCSGEFIVGRLKKGTYCESS